LELLKLLNESSLRQFSDSMFEKFDTDKGGKLELDEFLNLCNWVNPIWDKTVCIKK